MATRKIVPRADNEGGLGTALKRWATAFIAAITCTTINALTLAAASVGFTIAGGTTSKTLTVDETVAMSAKAPTESPTFTTKISAPQVAFPATQAPSSDPNTLDDYDEYTAAQAPCTGAVTASVIWRLVKIGKLVTLNLPLTQSAGVATTNFVYGTVIPAKYRPPFTLDFPALRIKDNGAYISTPGLLDVSTVGVISVYKDGTAASNFTATAQAGIDPVCVSWIIT